MGSLCRIAASSALVALSSTACGMPAPPQPPVVELADASAPSAVDAAPDDATAAADATTIAITPDAAIAAVDADIVTRPSRREPPRTPPVPSATGTGSPSVPCPPNFLAVANQSIFTCACPAGGGGGSVWGSSVYTRDSQICAAGVHAGAIGPNGGAVTVKAGPMCPSYVGTTKNGVTTANWGTYDRGSYYFSGVGRGTCDP